MLRSVRLRRHVASLLLVLGLPVVPSAADAAYTFTVIDAAGLFPGSVLTDTRGINNNGMLVGYASDYTSVTSFQYLNGVYSPLPAPPGGLKIDALGLNDNGLIVGGAFDPAGMRGFLLNGGSYSFIDRPPWTNTHFRAVNNAGLVTGMSDNLGGHLARRFSGRDLGAQVHGPKLFGGRRRRAGQVCAQRHCPERPQRPAGRRREHRNEQRQRDDRGPASPD